MIYILSWLAQRWAKKQQKAFYHLGEPLSDIEKAAFLPYFSLDILERVRKVVLGKTHPLDILTKIRLSMLKTVFRCRHLAGLTLINCVFLDRQSEASLPTLFHELVHVLQYDVLSAEGFLKRYFKSWAHHKFQYHQIALERVAYSLTHHYVTFPDKPFSVEERVLAGLEIK
ncbi:MAG: hypothetical protein HZC17_06460 [Candidatus Omnitrophica bacterium]|nr:hypothetical protein [Candidatus Omnitrophota bacterium]